jgi:hypothetical protein
MRNEETDLSFAEIGEPKRPYTASRNETELEEVANYLKGMARREGFDGSLRSLIESTATEALMENWCMRQLIMWRAGRDSRAAFGCEGFATRSVARNPRPSGSRASFARDALRQRSWLAKKNPNPRKINGLRSNDRHIAA